MAEQMMQDRVNEKVAKQTVPAGYKQTEVGLIPEDWHIYSLFMSWPTLVVELHLQELNMKNIINLVCTHG